MSKCHDIDLSSCTFKVKRELNMWGGLWTGMTGPNGIVSKIHRGRGRGSNVSKISAVALAIEKIIDKKINSIGIKDVPMAYVEYIRSDGEVIPCVVDYKNGSFTIKTKSFYDYMAPAVIYTAAISSDYIFSAFPDANEMAVDFTSPISTDEMLIACDAFYYGIASKCKCSIEENDTEDFELQMERLCSERETDNIRTNTPSLYFTDDPDKNTKKEQKGNTLRDEPLERFFRRCKEGEFIINYDWNEMQRKCIPSIESLNSFIPTESFRKSLLNIHKGITDTIGRMEKLRKKISPKDDSEWQNAIRNNLNELIGSCPINLKFIGKPGTGKTRMIEAIMASLGYPLGMINCKPNMEEDEIEGLYKFYNGKLYNIPTKCGELHSIGGAILLEEINLPDPGILQGTLGQAVVSPYIFKAYGFQELKRHPLTIYIATMNVGTNGARQVNQAFSSRFPASSIIEDAPKEEFIKILASGGFKKSDCSKVYRIYKKILNYLEQYNEELVLSVTLRHCYAALSEMQMGVSLEEACVDSFIGEIYSSDPETAKDLESVIKQMI